MSAEAGKLMVLDIEYDSVIYKQKEMSATPK